MTTVMEVSPDLVVWNAGTQDALARAEIDAFAAAAARSWRGCGPTAWTSSLSGPPYAAVVANDEHYSALVKSLSRVTQRQRVPMVLRYEAMRYLSSQQPASASQHFHLHDLVSGVALSTLRGR
jgi:hypothetical protein